MRDLVKAALAIALASSVIAGCTGSASPHHKTLAPAKATATPNGSRPPTAQTPTTRPTLTFPGIKTWAYRPPPAGQTWSTLTAAVATFGPASEASVPVTGRFGVVAVVVHALEIRSLADRSQISRGEMAEVLAQRDHSWYLQASIPIHDTRGSGPPVTGSPGRRLPRGWPIRVYLTGATDFVLPVFGFIDTGLAAVLSDIGNRWHLVPFRSPQGDQTEVDVLGRQSGPTSNAFITGTRCSALSCGGRVTYQRWVYVTNASVFEPTAAPYFANE